MPVYRSPVVHAVSAQYLHIAHFQATGTQGDGSTPLTARCGESCDSLGYSCTDPVLTITYLVHDQSCQSSMPCSVLINGLDSSNFSCLLTTASVAANGLCAGSAAGCVYTLSCSSISCATISSVAVSCPGASSVSCQNLGGGGDGG